MKRHDALLDEVMSAVRALFSDDSVSKEKTAESLREIKDEIENMLDAIEE